MVSKQEAILRNSIIGALRRCFSRCYIRREVLAEALHPTKRGPRGGKLYICQQCSDTVNSSHVQVDHIDPVIPYEKTAKDMEWGEIITRLFFCGKDNLQALCTKCHASKTAKERKIRSGFRRSKTAEPKPKGTKEKTT